MSVRNMELKTVSKVLTSDASALTIGGQVPSGMTRWVTFLAVDNMLKTNTETTRLYLISAAVSNPTEASFVATGNRKMLINIRASKVLDITPDGVPLQIPRQPDTDKPLFSISSGKWLGAYCSTTSGNLFVQYYDE